MWALFQGWRRVWGSPLSPLSMMICVVFIIGLAFVLQSPQVGSHPVPRPAAAKMRLKMADEVLKSGDEPLARIMLKQIVEDYGDTPTSQEAKDRLERLGEP